MVVRAAWVRSGAQLGAGVSYSGDGGRQICLDSIAESTTIGKDLGVPLSRCRRQNAILWHFSDAFAWNHCNLEACRGARGEGWWRIRSCKTS